MTIEEIKKIANELYPHAQIVDYNAIGYDAFVKGAMWMQEQYEINEEELDTLANEYDSTVEHYINNDKGYTINYRIVEAFKAGYRAALKQ